MIVDLASSYSAMVKFYGGDSVESPEVLSRESELQRSVVLLDQLCEHVFSRHVADTIVYWGVKRSSGRGAWVECQNGKAYVLVDSGALLRIRACRDDPAFQSWLASDLCPQLLSDWMSSAIYDGTLLATFEMLGLAMLLGHELGHLLDASCDGNMVSTSHNAFLAEEISADGHAMQIGLQLAHSWANDQAALGVGKQGELFQVAVVLLLIAHSMLDEIDVAVSWERDSGESHPPPSQRFVATCVVAAERTRGLDPSFPGVAFVLAGEGLAVLGVLPGQSSLASLEQLLDAHDDELVQQQYSALRRALKKRRK